MSNVIADRDCSSRYNVFYRPRRAMKYGLAHNIINVQSAAVLSNFRLVIQVVKWYLNYIVFLYLLQRCLTQ